MILLLIALAGIAALAIITSVAVARIRRRTDAELVTLRRRLADLGTDIGALRAALDAERAQRDLEAINADLLRLKQAADRTTAADGLVQPSYLRSAVAACERRIATRTREEC